MLSLLLLAATATSPNKGTIVMYRGSTVWGAAAACPIRYKGSDVAELGRGKYVEWSVEPGRYILTNKRSSVEVAVSAGETRYVRCQIRGSMIGGGAELQVVDEADFEKRRSDFTRKEMAAATPQ